MRYSDILVKHLYYVDYNPVQSCEFDGKHLSLVLKKNDDKQTVIVVPLTTSSNGEGSNKLNVGKILTLPPNLRSNDSYVTYNQVRTVNYKRFYALKDDSRNRVSSSVDDELFRKVISLCLDELVKNLTLEEKLEYHQRKYKELVMVKVINIAYDIKRLLDSNIESKEIELKRLQTSVISLLKSDIGYIENISDNDQKNGIVDIIKKCLDNTVVELLQSEKKIS